MWDTHRLWHWKTAADADIFTFSIASSAIFAMRITQFDNEQ
jgi:hypothetical protein